VRGILTQLGEPDVPHTHAVQSLADAMLPELEALLQLSEDRVRTLEKDEDLASVIAKRAASGLTVDCLIDLMELFDRGHMTVPKPKGGLRWDNARAVFVYAFRDQFTHKVRNLLREWHRRNAWDPDRELGIITAKPRRKRPA
jgi:hypothetical protein